MLVLFSGSRGSGKSTIAKNLYSNLDNFSFEYLHQSQWRKKSNNIFSKILWIFYFLTFFRFQVCKVFFKRFYRDIRSRRAKMGIARIYLPCIFSYHLVKLKDKKEKCVIYESDFVTWSADKVLDNTFYPSEVENYYKSVILPNVNEVLVVICDTPLDFAFERWSHRENKILSSKARREWINKRKVWKKAREKVFDVLSKIPNIRIIKLNGLEDPKKNSSHIANILLNKE